MTLSTFCLDRMRVIGAVYKPDRFALELRHVFPRLFIEYSRAFDQEPIDQLIKNS
jgi:hypothetical protein